MRSAREEHYRLNAPQRLKTLYKLERQSPVPILICVHVMGFIDEHEVPGPASSCSPSCGRRSPTFAAC